MGRKKSGWLEWVLQSCREAWYRGDPPFDLPVLDYPALRYGVAQAAGYREPPQSIVGLVANDLGLRRFWPSASCGYRLTRTHYANRPERCRNLSDGYVQLQAWKGRLPREALEQNKRLKAARADEVERMRENIARGVLDHPPGPAQGANTAELFDVTRDAVSPADLALGAACLSIGAQAAQADAQGSRGAQDVPSHAPASRGLTAPSSGPGEGIVLPWADVPQRPASQQLPECMR